MAKIKKVLAEFERVVFKSTIKERLRFQIVTTIGIIIFGILGIIWSPKETLAIIIVIIFVIFWDILSIKMIKEDKKNK